MKKTRQIMQNGMRIATLLLAVLMCFGMAFGFAGCGKKVTHFVDYNGEKFAYRGARDAYRTGEKVTLYYNFIASDTDYAFYLDNEKLSPEYSEEDGFKIQFVMPDHDVVLKCVADDSMTEDTSDVQASDEDMKLKDEGTAVVRYDVLTGSEEDGDRYTLTLSSYPDDKYILDVYGVTYPDGKEAYVRFVVPSEVYTECMSVIDKGSVRQWKSLPAGPAIEGKLVSCMFLDGDKTVEVTSDHMPIEGEQALDAVRETLEKYVPKGNN